jgi:hypothetical protein
MIQAFQRKPPATRLAKKRPKGTSKKNSKLCYWKSRNLSPAPMDQLVGYYDLNQN